MQAFSSSIAYLLSLRTNNSKNGPLLASHRRKTCVIGLVTNVLSIQSLALDVDH